MSISRIIQDEHDAITMIMQELGYRSDEQGVCAGIVLMGLRAFLCGDLKKFRDRAKFIKETAGLADKIKRVQAKRALQRRLSQFSKLDDFEQQCIDVLAFFDGIELYFQPQAHKTFFNKPITVHDVNEISNLVHSDKISELGGFVKLNKSWLGVYTQDEFLKYLQIIAAKAGKYKQNITLSLDSITHKVGLCYDYEAKKWILLEANKLALHDLPSNKDLIEQVYSAFYEDNKHIALGTTFYTVGTQQETVQKIVDEVSEVKEVRTMHRLTKEKSDYKLKIKSKKSKNEFGLDYIASQLGHANIISDMINLKQTVNKPSLCGTDAVNIAAQYRQIQAIQTLIAAKADVNKPNALGATAVYYAAQLGYDDVIRTLAGAKANVNVSRGNGWTPVLIAACNKNSAALRALAECHANLTHANHDGVTAAIFAAHNNDVESLTILAKHGVDLSARAPNGLTPLEFAQRFNHGEAVKYLTDYLANKNSKPYKGATIPELARMSLATGGFIHQAAPNRCEGEMKNSIKTA